MHASPPQDVNKGGGTLGRCLMRLDHHWIPSYKCRRRQASHDGERKVERADAQPGTARQWRNDVLLPSHCGQSPLHQRLLSLLRVKAEKVDALAYLVDGIYHRLAHLLHHQLGQRQGFGLNNVRRLPQYSHALTQLRGVLAHPRRAHGPSVKSMDQSVDRLGTGTTDGISAMRALLRDEGGCPSEERGEVGVLEVNSTCRQPAFVDCPGGVWDHRRGGSTDGGTGAGGGGPELDVGR
mmetsp:Transcript_3816/g.5928  ORF Transcript_3816/g.5928 Transcript_3816/m.5928 type:complete len:237 (-) Transcript_3816:1931-2641(-)